MANILDTLKGAAKAVTGFVQGAEQFAFNAGQNLGGLLVNPERVNPNIQAVAATIQNTFTPANSTNKQGTNAAVAPLNLINTFGQAAQVVLNPSSAAFGVGYAPGFSAGGAVTNGVQTNVAKQVSNNVLKSIPDVVSGVSQGIVNTASSIKAAAEALGFKTQKQVLDTNTGKAVMSPGATNSLEIPADLLSALLGPRVAEATSGYAPGTGSYNSYSPAPAEVSSTNDASAGSNFAIPGLSPSLLALFGLVIVGFIFLKKAA